MFPAKRSSRNAEGSFSASAMGQIEAVDGVATNDDAAVIGDLNDEAFYWLLSDAVEIAPLTGIDGKLNLWELPSAQERKAPRSALPAR